MFGSDRILLTRLFEGVSTHVVTDKCTTTTVLLIVSIRTVVNPIAHFRAGNDLSRGAPESLTIIWTGSGRGHSWRKCGRWQRVGWIGATRLEHNVVQSNV